MKKLYPVIHVDTLEQALANLEICIDAQADGAFLINHEISAMNLDMIYMKCRTVHPTFFLGLNFLDLSPTQAMNIISDDANALWVDNASIVEDQVEQPYAQNVLDIKDDEVFPWRGQYFGGVAFKYQKPVKDLEKVAAIAKNYMDVVCTSGPGTGKAADIDKLVRMKSAIGTTPLAVASGITLENVLLYKDCVDIFMVATGISVDHLNLDPEKTKALAERIHSM